jgi:hypothetical protein
MFFSEEKDCGPLLHDLNEKRKDYLKKPAIAADNPTPPSPQPPPPTNPVSVPEPPAVTWQT